MADELLSADELVLVAPVYNFGIPAAMKAWIDQVVRAGRTPEVLVIATEELQLHGESAVTRAFEAIDVALDSIASA